MIVSTATLGVPVPIIPPGAPTVDGKSLFEDQALSSATPTLAWTAPSIGKAGLYWLRFTRLYKGAGGATERDNGVPALWTDGSSLTVPPGVLLPGEVYVLVINAVMEEGLDYQRTLASGACFLAFRRGALALVAINKCGHSVEFEVEAGGNKLWLQAVYRDVLSGDTLVLQARRQRLTLPDLGLSIEHRRVEDMVGLALPEWLESAISGSASA